MRLPDRLSIGTPCALDGSPSEAPHVELTGYAELPAPAEIRALAGDRTVSLTGWHVLTHKRTDPRYRAMTAPPPEHAAVGHFERSRWTDEAWDSLDALARAVDAQAVIFQTPPTFKSSTEHATRLENFVAHATRPGLALCWEWAPGSWPDGKALDLCDHIGAVAVIDPTERAIPDGELIYLRFRGGARGRKPLRDDDLKNVALEARDRIGWVIFSNTSAAADADRLRQML
jgi:uncharacterized protein YecE (DUF72 family)